MKELLLVKSKQYNICYNITINDLKQEINDLKLDTNSFNLKDNNDVKKLASCEIMGGANNICSDKTGTLTLNKMKVKRIWSGSDI